METDIRPGPVKRTTTHAATSVQPKRPIQTRMAREHDDVAISSRIVDVPIAAPRQVPAIFVPISAPPVQKANPVPGTTIITAPPAQLPPPDGIQIVIPSPDVIKVPPGIMVPDIGPDVRWTAPSGGGATASTFEADVTTVEQVEAEAEQKAGGLSFVTLLGGGAVGFLAAGPIGGVVGAVVGYFAARKGAQ